MDTSGIFTDEVPAVQFEPWMKMAHKIDRLQEGLKKTSFFWKVQQEVKLQTMASGKLSPEEIKEAIDEILEDSGMKKKLKNLVHRMQEGAMRRAEATQGINVTRSTGGDSRAAAAGAAPPPPLALPLPRRAGEEEGRDNINAARRRWERSINEELLAMGQERGRPLARLRGGDGEDGAAKGGENNPPLRFLFDSEDLRAVITMIEPENRSRAFAPGPHQLASIKLLLDVPSLEDLQEEFKELSPAYRQAGLDDLLEGSEAFAAARLALGRRVTGGAPPRGGGGGGGEGGAEAAAAGGGDPPLYLYWTGSQWMLNYDEDPSLNIMNCIAYSKADVADPRAASPWFVRDGPRRWRPAPALALVARGAPTPGALAGAEAEGEGSKRAAALREGKAELKARDADTLRALTPIFVTFVLDSISTGMVLPLLPFFIMSQGASPFQLGLVVALTYAAQTLGCLALGKFSDRRGRRPAMLACAAGSIFAYYGVASSRSLAQVALVRMGGGLLGALVPLSQAAIADRCPVDLRTKYIGVLQASAGAGFVVGPIIGLFLQKVLGLSQRAVFKTASLVAVTGTAYAALRLKESRPPAAAAAAAAAAATGTAAIKVDDSGAGGGGRAVVPFPVLLLTGNGFLLMYAFAVETVYAAFLKDNFGYGESVLATLFVLNGMSVGMLQVFFIKKLVNKLGKHMLLVLGNALLAAGMVGLALIRQPLVHFAMFSVHILGYAIADTALSSLISRYSSPDTQGTHLGLNQAVQSFARMISPLVAGALYQRSKRAGALPVGALPYLAGAAAPLLAVLPPFFLYARSVNKKIKDSSLEELSVVHKFLKNQVFDTFEKEDSSGGNSTINLKRNRGAGTGDDDDW